MHACCAQGCLPAEDRTIETMHEEHHRGSRHLWAIVLKVQLHSFNLYPLRVWIAQLLRWHSVCQGLWLALNQRLDDLRHPWHRLLLYLHRYGRYQPEHICFTILSQVPAMKVAYQNA